MSGLVICVIILIPIAAVAYFFSEGARYKRAWNNGYCRCGGQWDVTVASNCTTFRCKRCDKTELFCYAGPGPL